MHFGRHCLYIAVVVRKNSNGGIGIRVVSQHAVCMYSTFGKNKSSVGCLESSLFSFTPNLPTRMRGYCTFSVRPPPRPHHHLFPTNDVHSFPCFGSNVSVHSISHPF